MELFDAVRCENDLALDAETDKDLRLVLQILRSEVEGGDERRQFSRASYVTRASVELADPMGHVLRLAVWSRDANQWGVGMVSQVVLPVGETALMQIEGGDGVDVRARGYIVRSREVLPGWYESAILFELEQPSLSPGLLSRQA